MPRRGLWIVPFLVGCIAAAAFFVLRLGAASAERHRLAGASAVELGPKYEIETAMPSVVAASEEAPFDERQDDRVDEMAAGEISEEDPRVEIARTNALYLSSLLEADAAGYASTYLDEALAVPPQGPVLRGRAAIEQAMLATFAAYRFVSAEMGRIDLRLVGETAIETGHYRYDVASVETGAEQTLSGRYAIVWKRHDNAWRIAFDTTQPGVFA